MGIPCWTASESSIVGFFLVVVAKYLRAPVVGLLPRLALSMVALCGVLATVGASPMVGVLVAPLAVGGGSKRLEAGVSTCEACSEVTGTGSG